MIEPLERDHSCMRSLAFRMDLTHPESSAAFTSIALELGFALEQPIAGLSKLVAPEGHELLLVRSTGRVQLRVSYLVAQDRRRHVAEDIYCRIVRRARALSP